MLGLKSVEVAHDYLRLMSRDLFRRLMDDKMAYKRRPASLVLAIRHKGGKRTTKQAHLPLHIASAEDLFKVSKSLLKTSLNLSKPFSLTLIGLSCNSFANINSVGATQCRTDRPKSMISNYFRSKERGIAQKPLRVPPVSVPTAAVTNTTLTADNVDFSVLNELPEGLRQEILQTLNTSSKRTTKKKSVTDYFRK